MHWAEMPFLKITLRPTAARVTCQHRQFYLVYGEQGEVSAEIPGKMRHQAQAPSCRPWAIG